MSVPGKERPSRRVKNLMRQSMHTRYLSMSPKVESKLKLERSVYHLSLNQPCCSLQQQTEALEIEAKLGICGDDLSNFSHANRLPRYDLGPLCGLKAGTRCNMVNARSLGDKDAAPED